MIVITGNNSGVSKPNRTKINACQAYASSTPTLAQARTALGLTGSPADTSIVIAHVGGATIATLTAGTMAAQWALCNGYLYNILTTAVPTVNT